MMTVDEIYYFCVPSLIHVQPAISALATIAALAGSSLLRLHYLLMLLHAKDGVKYSTDIFQASII